MRICELLLWALGVNRWAHLCSGGKKWEQEGIEASSSQVPYARTHTHTQLGLFFSLSRFSLQPDFY